MFEPIALDLSSLSQVAGQPLLSGGPGADPVFGIPAPAALGTGTPAPGTYLDGGSGAWTALPASGGTPGGADGSIQYASGGAFGGFGSWDATNKLLTLAAGAATGALSGSDQPAGSLTLNSTSAATKGRINLSHTGSIWIDATGNIMTVSTILSTGYKSSSDQFFLSASGLNLPSSGQVTWTASGVWFGAQDTAFGRAAAGETYTRGSGGTAAHRLQAQSSTAAGRDAGRITCAWSVATDAGRLADMILWSDGYNGAHEAIRFRDTGAISQPIIPLVNLRDAADDAAAAALSPAVPIGGLYRTGGALKIRTA